MYFLQKAQRRCCLGCSTLGDLILAIDLSEDGPKVIALVGAKASVIKTRVFGNLCSGLEHYREVPSRMKVRYLRFFERRYLRLKDFLSIARVLLYIDKVNDVVRSLDLGLAVIDDKLFNSVDVEQKIRESDPKPRHIDNLFTIADNLANYFRILLKKEPRRLLEELRKFEK